MEEYIMKLKVDTNDLDIRYYNIKVKSEDIPHITLVCKALDNFNYIQDRYNYPTGGKYGYTMVNICKSNAKDNLIKGGLESEESFNIFQKYIKQKTFHTIHKIVLNDNVLFKLLK